MGKKGPLWWRESDWLLRGSSAANQILLHHSGPILSHVCQSFCSQGSVYPSMPCKSAGGVSQHALQVSRPTPGGSSLRGLARGVSKPTPRGGVEGSDLGALQAHT